MAKMQDTSRETKPHVLLIYREMIPSIRLCGHCQMEYLASQGLVDYAAKQEMDLSDADINWATVILLGRLDNRYEYLLTLKLHECGKYIIYIIDDDLLNVPTYISSDSYYTQKSIPRYIRQMIEMSQAIISPSPRLLEKYAGTERAHIQIEEPAFNPIPYQMHDPSKPIKIGFAGSIDRTADIEHILQESLIRIKQEYGDLVRFEFLGANPAFAKDIDAKQVPYCTSYDEYRNMLNDLKWDIGLAPMPDTPFHACKHYNKFVEYAAAGILGVFSDVQPYSRLRELGFGPAVFVSGGSDAWYAALRSLIEHRADLESQRKSLTDCVENKISIQASSEALFKQIQDLKITQGHQKVFHLSVLLKICGYIERILRALLSRCIRLLKKIRRMLTRSR